MGNYTIFTCSKFLGEVGKQEILEPKVQKILDLKSNLVPRAFPLIFFREKMGTRLSEIVFRTGISRKLTLHWFWRSKRRTQNPSYSLKKPLLTVLRQNTTSKVIQRLFNIAEAVDPLASPAGVFRGRNTISPKNVCGGGYGPPCSLMKITEISGNREWVSCA